jgi:hypothetical protein
MMRKFRTDNFDKLVTQRLALLFDFYDDSSGDDSGGGSALASITAAAASLGSAYILSQRQPQQVQVPQTTIPAYGASASLTGGSNIFLIGAVFVGAILLFFLATK